MCTRLVLGILNPERARCRMLPAYGAGGILNASLTHTGHDLAARAAVAAGLVPQGTGGRGVTEPGWNHVHAHGLAIQARNLGRSLKPYLVYKLTTNFVFGVVSRARNRCVTAPIRRGSM